MTNFVANLPHLIMGTVVIAAASTLAAMGVISGAEALAVIGTAAGFSLGVGGSSTSLSTAANAMPAVSSSSGGSTTMVTPALGHVGPVVAVPKDSSPTPATPPVQPMSAGS